MLVVKHERRQVDMYMIPAEVADLLGSSAVWREQALCAQTDPEAFFPQAGETTTAAKRICARCTVSAECLDEALRHRERFGVWGGMSPQERTSILRRAA